MTEGRQVQFFQLVLVAAAATTPYTQRTRARGLRNSECGDHALLGVDDVNFLNAVVAGDSIRLEWEEIEFLPWKSAGRELLRMKWRVLNQFDELCMEASSRMLVRVIAK